jgi:hypothetical protein
MLTPVLRLEWSVIDKINFSIILRINVVYSFFNVVHKKYIIWRNLKKKSKYFIYQYKLTGTASYFKKKTTI